MCSIADFVHKVNLPGTVPGASNSALSSFTATTLIIYEILKKSRQLFKNSEFTAWFFGLNALLYLIWILWYNMTDVAIFDERAFLLLMIFVGTIFSLSYERTSRIG